MKIVGNLSNSATRADIEENFRKCGKIMEVELKNGFGFVEFEHPKDADDAVKELDGKTIQGSRIRVEKSLGGKKRDRTDRRDRNSNPYRTDYRILIENLPSSVNWQRLKDFARDGGEVSYTDVRRDGVGFENLKSNFL